MAVSKGRSSSRCHRKPSIVLRTRRGRGVQGFLNGVQRGIDQINATHGSGRAGIAFYDTTGSIDAWSSDDALSMACTRVILGVGTREGVCLTAVVFERARVTTLIAVNGGGLTAGLVIAGVTRLEVHHRSYDRRGFEQPEDVIVPCLHVRQGTRESAALRRRQRMERLRVHRPRCVRREGPSACTRRTAGRRAPPQD